MFLAPSFIPTVLGDPDPNNWDQPNNSPSRNKNSLRTKSLKNVLGYYLFSDCLRGSCLPSEDDVDPEKHWGMMTGSSRLTCWFEHFFLIKTTVLEFSYLVLSTFSKDLTGVLCCSDGHLDATLMQMSDRDHSPQLGPRASGLSPSGHWALPVGSSGRRRGGRSQLRLSTLRRWLIMNFIQQLYPVSRCHQ